jgi:hypothetical protein
MDLRPLILLVALAGKEDLPLLSGRGELERDFGHLWEAQAELRAAMKETDLLKEQFEGLCGEFARMSVDERVKAAATQTGTAKHLLLCDQAGSRLQARIDLLNEVRDAILRRQGALEERDAARVRAGG